MIELEFYDRMRDKIKDEIHFERFIKEELEATRQLQTDLDLNKIATTKIPSMNRVITRSSLQVLIARYSMGLNIDSLVDDFDETSLRILSAWSVEGWYVELLWKLSLGTLLVRVERFQGIATLLDNYKFRDFVFDTLLRAQVPGHKISQRLEWPDSYRFLKQAMQSNRVDAAEVIKQYLDQWYKAHDDCYWHDYHKETFPLYFGYWSFEAAAITAIINIDDSSYRDNPYYPKDLVDYYRAQK